MSVINFPSSVEMGCKSEVKELETAFLIDNKSWADLLELTRGNVRAFTISRLDIEDGPNSEEHDVIQVSGLADEVMEWLDMLTGNQLWLLSDRSWRWRFNIHTDPDDPGDGEEEDVAVNG